MLYFALLLPLLHVVEEVRVRDLGCIYLAGEVVQQLVVEILYAAFIQLLLKDVLYLILGGADKGGEF